MDLAKLQNIATQLKKDKNSSNFGGEYPKAAFIPDGTHKGRFIVDPDDEVYHKMFTYGYFSRGIEDPVSCKPYDPEHPDTKGALPEGFDTDNHPLKTLATILADDYNKWGRSRKFVFLTYFYLISTDAPNENWQPGNLYCIIGNGKFADSFTDMLSSLVADSPEHLLKSLNPSKEGPVMQIIYQGGSQGKCNIGATLTTHPAIVERTNEDTDETYAQKISELGYRSLRYSYIYPGFNKDKYDNLVKQYTEELEKLANGTTTETDKPDEKTSESEKVEEKPATEVKLSSDTSGDKVESPVEEKKVLETSSAAEDPFAKYRKKPS